MRGKACWVAAAALAACLIFVTGGGAATTTIVTLTVNWKADSTTPCTIENHKSIGTCTLRGAILAANAMQQDNTVFVVKVPAWTYRLAWGSIDIAAATAKTGNVVRIVGTSKTVGRKKHKRTIPRSVIDAGFNPKPASVFVIDSPTQISNLVITGGTGNPGYVCDNGLGGCGGGIFVDSALDLERSVVRNNTACSDYTGKACTGTYMRGGGIYLADDNVRKLVTLSKTTVEHNTAGNGGGIDNANTQPSSVLITASSIDDNTACDTFANRVCIGVGDGGGIYNSGEFTLDRSTVSGNTAGSSSLGTGTRCGGGNGGGIWNSWTLSVVDRSAITGNIADCGGGLYNAAGGTSGISTFDLANSTMSGNRALENGGAVWTSGADTGALSGVTITKNRAGRHTGGVWDDQVGAVLFGAGDTITQNTGRGACKNVTYPCS